MKKQHHRLLNQGLLVLLLALGAFTLLRLWPGQAPTPTPSAQTGGDIAVIYQDHISYLDQLPGAFKILYFGYTSCPDICPTSLFNLAQAYNKLDESQRGKLQAIFITVDPERDTSAKANDYARYYHPAFIGAGTNIGQLLIAAKAFGVVYQKVESPDSAMAYTIDHSSLFYLTDHDGKVIESFSSHMSADKIADILEHHLEVQP